MRLPRAAVRCFRVLVSPPRHRAVEHRFDDFNQTQIRQGRRHQEDEEHRWRRDKAEPPAPGHKRKADREGDRPEIRRYQEPARRTAEKQPPGADAKHHESLSRHQLDKPSGLKQSFARAEECQHGVEHKDVTERVDDRATIWSDQAIIQPFSSWALDDGISVSVQSQTTAIWSAPPAYRWTVPLGPTVTKLVEFDKSMQAQIGASLYWNVVRPLYGSTWTASFVFNLLLPS